MRTFRQLTVCVQRTVRPRVDNFHFCVLIVGSRHGNERLRADLHADRFGGNLNGRRNQIRFFYDNGDRFFRRIAEIVGRLEGERVFAAHRVAAFVKLGRIAPNIFHFNVALCIVIRRNFEGKFLSLRNGYDVFAVVRDYGCGGIVHKTNLYAINIEDCLRRRTRTQCKLKLIQITVLGNCAESFVTIIREEVCVISCV